MKHIFRFSETPRPHTRIKHGKSLVKRKRIPDVLIMGVKKSGTMTLGK